MKRWYICSISLLIALLTYAKLNAQGAEKIFPLTKVIKEEAYYLQQANLWRDSIEKNYNRAAAWLNHYIAARNYNVLSGNPHFKLLDIVKGAEQAIPKSFEYHYLYFWQSPIQYRAYDHLFEAHKIAPDRLEAYHDLITYYELKRELDQKNSYCEKWYKANGLSPGILNWNYNALMSVEEEAILLTQGDNSTYPAWVLQSVLGVRPEVNVLNLYLLVIDTEYRRKIFEELNIPLTLSLPAGNNFDVQQSLVIEHLASHSTRPIYLGIALSSGVRKFLEDKLYLTGLSFKFSETSIDNIALIRNNYENLFRVEDLWIPIAYDPAQTVVDYINMNYIPSLVLLHQHYQSTGEDQKANKTKQLALLLAEKNEKKSEVLSYFKPPLRPDVMATHIDIKSIEKNMVFLKDEKYVSKYETSNEEYEAFLKDLLQQKAFDLLQVSKIGQVDWLDLLPEDYRKDAELEFDEMGHPEAPNKPVVNISYEGAKLYCEWLTKIYNQWDHRRKKYKQVRFYIPTEEEWILAANSMTPNIPYPWGGFYYKNAKQCYLTNVNPYLSLEESTQAIKIADRPESPGEDGVFTLADVEAYYPNDLGLFNISGNVAEMVEGGAFTMGGSWLDPVDFAKIGVRHERSLPSPAVGFRIFMEIIEN